jgi:HPt (histidine-containing phosphotransfer) domain-containing protein
MAETPEDFSVHRFVQELFEDLGLTLPSLGCRFHGTVTPNALTVHGRPLFLKSKLFLLFADLATQTPRLDAKFRPAVKGADLSLGFFCQPFSASACRLLPTWDSLVFELFSSEEGEGFRFTLPAGAPPEIGPPVHWRQLSQLYGGQANGYQVLDHFLTRCETLLPELDEAIRAQDCQLVLRVAHTLKGSARGVTAEALAEAALQLEMLGRSGDLKAAGHLYKGLLVTYDEFIHWVQEGRK